MIARQSCWDLEFHKLSKFRLELKMVEESWAATMLSQGDYRKLMLLFDSLLLLNGCFIEMM